MKRDNVVSIKPRNRERPDSDGLENEEWGLVEDWEMIRLITEFDILRCFTFSATLIFFYVYLV